MEKYMKCSCPRCEVANCPHNTLKLKIDMFQTGFSNMYYTEKCPLNENYREDGKNAF